MWVGVTVKVRFTVRLTVTVTLTVKIRVRVTRRYLHQQPQFRILPVWHSHPHLPVILMAFTIRPMRLSYRPTKNPRWRSFTEYLRSVDRSWLFFTIHLHDICNSFHCYKLLLSQTIARLTKLCLHFAPEEYICPFLNALSINKQVIGWNIPQKKILGEVKFGLSQKAKTKA